MARMTSTKKGGLRNRGTNVVEYSPIHAIGSCPQDGEFTFGIHSDDKRFEIATSAKEFSFLALNAKFATAHNPVNFGFALDVMLDRNYDRWVVKLDGRMLRRNFHTAADAYAWAEKTDVQNLRLYRYACDVLGGEDYDVDWQMKFIWAEDLEDAYIGAIQNGTCSPVIQEWKNKKWNWTTVPTSLWYVLDTKRFRDDKYIVRFYGPTEESCVEFLTHYHDQERVRAGDFHIEGQGNEG